MRERPLVLLMDEPTYSLDVESERRVFEWFVRVADPAPDGDDHGDRLAPILHGPDRETGSLSSTEVASWSRAITRSCSAKAGVMR
jgi:hypothetical protein